MAVAREAEAKKNSQREVKNQVKKKLHLAMKVKRYADVDAIQKASTAIFNAILKKKKKKSFDNLLEHENRCIQCEFRRRPIKCLLKKTF